MNETNASANQIEDELSDQLSDEVSDEVLERASWDGVGGVQQSCARTNTSGSTGCGNACC